jgi:hypothetical protein
MSGLRRWPRRAYAATEFLPVIRSPSVAHRLVFRAVIHLVLEPPLSSQKPGRVALAQAIAGIACRRATSPVSRDSTGWRKARTSPVR